MRIHIDLFNGDNNQKIADVDTQVDEQSQIEPLVNQVVHQVNEQVPGIKNLRVDVNVN